MSITERITRNTDARFWKDEFPLENRYTVGLAGERFFRAILEQGRLLATPCPRCAITYLPPRLYCERCFTELEQWVDAGTTGEVHSFTLGFIDDQGAPREKPSLVALVRIGDTDGFLIHHLGEVEPEEVYVGMPVEAVFLPKEKRHGNMKDIKYFRPLSGT